jgi:hypothetical protein
MIIERTTVVDASASAVAEAHVKVRATFRAVVRWRALYSRMRPRMKQLHPCDATRLHHRLKDCEDTAIEEHQAAERRLLELLFLNGEHLDAPA